MDFIHIVPRCGGQREAFEELCCQLANRTVHKDVSFVRLHGAGGDGGIECYADLPDGNRTGWQAKYVFNIDALLSQATESLNTALDIHPTLSKFIICFPFDLTGPTGRRGLSGTKKFEKWKNENEKKAMACDRILAIEAWPAFKIRTLALEHDRSRGIREFFFNQNILTNEWFTERLNESIGTAGPRYTPNLNVRTDLWKWFSAFGRTSQWSDEFSSHLKACRKENEHLVSSLKKSDHDSMSPDWPHAGSELAKSIVYDLGVFLDNCNYLKLDSNGYKTHVSKMKDIITRLHTLETVLAQDIEAKHGPGMADSQGFRQFMAEYMVTFPAANLDYTRDTINAVTNFHNWICSPACSLAFESVFVLTGVAGSGKTHGICDVAETRLNDGHLTLIFFGHQFRGEPDPFTRILETLGLPVTLGINGLLDILNTAAEASRTLLILCIDAINETRPLKYWRDRLSAFAKSIQQRPNLRLCFTCRTSFFSYCVPDSHEFPISEHAGFTGLERDACRQFFFFYQLDPPIAPILQPELSNPLYLRLLCETLRSLGLRRLPLGWQGFSHTIRAFLEEKERQFSLDHEISIGSRIVTGSLMAVVRAIADTGESGILWSQAQTSINDLKPQAKNLPVLEWLIRADLLIEDVPKMTNSFDNESVVRPAFERLGDFLIASELIERCNQDILSATMPGGILYPLLKDTNTVMQNNGILSALSILIPERFPKSELPDLVTDKSIRDLLLDITIQSLPSRDVTTFTSVSEHYVRQALFSRELFSKAMDSILALSWQSSELDAFWLHGFLMARPFAIRDSFWCGYLHTSFETHGMVCRLIDAAYELPLKQLESDIGKRWVTVLLWFCASADRRVKDFSTRAAVAILIALPELILEILECFIHCDDDEIRERAFISCYGAMICSRDHRIIAKSFVMLRKAYRHSPEEFDNALIRDDIRCIGELARELNSLEKDCNPELTLEPINSEWPLKLPSADDVNAWSKVIHFAPGHLCDFFVYSMNCLKDWQHAFSKKKMGEWIVQRIAHDFDYINSGCERYDNYMLGKYGGGRSKPEWAERIGKKYQWIALYHLASKLHDHLKRKRDRWSPKLLRRPFILLEERKIDTTLPKMSVRENKANPWWIKSPVDLGSSSISDDKWVATEMGVPPLEKLLPIFKHEGQNWLLLASYASWGHGVDNDWKQPYRHSWIHIQSYLVHEKFIKDAYACLNTRNFFGAWMPQSSSWLYGFVGEYPWGTAFNTEPESWNSLGGDDKMLSFSCKPSWSRIAVEWEYDASLSRRFHMIVPSRKLFTPKDLWWNGRDGFRLIGGRTVFQDPSIDHPGPSSLITDADDFHQRINSLGYRIIWTMLGEKLICGDSHNDNGKILRGTFSQIACLKRDSSLAFGELVFFEDYNKDTGPLILKRKKS